MAQFASHSPGTPCWIDLMSPDVDSSKAFYSAIFGWDTADQFDDDGNRVYTMFSKGGKSVAGLGGQPPGAGEMPAMWNSYVATDDVAATAAKVVAAGGSVMMPPMQVFGAGEMAIFVDPTGAVISVWKAGQHVGAELANEPDTYSWNELMTRDVDTALEFYRSVFGWSYDAQDMGPMGSYNVIAGGESGGLGGIMSMPPGLPDQVPNHWGVYFTVADLEAKIAAVKDAGGQIVMGPTAIPGIGTSATCHDPAGGNFNILQPESMQ